MADSCRTGAATNVIFGLALGYKSVIIPIFAIALSIYVSFSLAAMYGIAVAALGMLSTIATGLAIDAYGPISDNAGGIAEMAGMSHKIRDTTDALDAAGNTTAAIGKVRPNHPPFLHGSDLMQTYLDTMHFYFRVLLLGRLLLFLSPYLVHMSAEQALPQSMF